MKKQLTLLTIAVVLVSAGSAASAADSKLKNGAKKVGAAIVWPFKEVGKGLKAMGNGMKHMVGK